ncbi:MAG: 4-hydroxy-3-methylbut-2-enyl diphosphate reductase [Candidatus Omnitrophica bacterium]|nr:4-hydroxy-3-methylbut-2-enyl diphosphate reductase [Candidatus Omnitrophota bacterium]
MKINLAKSAGFCFGVRRAINIALKTASIGKTVHMLGDIVHNEDVEKQIQESCITKIKNLRLGKGKIFLVRAHGIDNKTLLKAKKLGYQIIDATCPMVKEIHRIVRHMESECEKIIVIGDKKHDEVRGIVDQLKKRALVIEGLKDIPTKEIKRLKNACVVVQSTQNFKETLKIISFLKNYIRNLSFFNTICQPTRLKQQEVRTMPLKNDLMIIIGSKNSANTKRLYEISKSLNKRTYWINAKRDIRERWFRKVKTVGITAGASTPDYTTKSIIKYIKELNNKLSPACEWSPSA